MLASCARSALPRVLRTSRCTRWPLQTPLRPPLPRAAAAAEQLVLGIESSCDDTAAAVVSSSGCVLGEAIASQEDVHKAWGGVVPSLAMEAHAAAIDGVVAAALGQAGVALGDLDAVAVTIGPGLSMCLKVGVEKARALAHEGHVPVVPCHHMEAHALVARLGAERDVPFPFLCLLVSGGHNLLLLARGVGDYVQARAPAAALPVHRNANRRNFYFFAGPTATACRSAPRWTTPSARRTTRSRACSASN